MIPLPSHGLPANRERGVLSGIIFINRNGLRWSGAPKEYRPAKNLYNRWKRWVEMGVFPRMMEVLACEAAVSTTVMIDAIYLKAHRTASCELPLVALFFRTELQAASLQRQKKAVPNSNECFCLRCRRNQIAADAFASRDPAALQGQRLDHYMKALSD